jgi:hypothetical protein
MQATCRRGFEVPSRLQSTANTDRGIRLRSGRNSKAARHCRLRAVPLFSLFRFINNSTFLVFACSSAYVVHLPHGTNIAEFTLETCENKQGKYKNIRNMTESEDGI